MKKHFVGKNQHLQANLCLYCGTLLDAASGIDTNAKPDPNDVSLCISCGGVMVFDEDLNLRKPTPAEDLEFTNNEQVQAGRRAISMLPKKVSEEKPS